MSTQWAELDCILHDQPIADSASVDALRVMEIIDRVYRQAKVSYG